MPNYVYPAIGLIGGTAGFLDAIDGTALADKDMAMVSVQGDKTYFYVLNATSGAAEASPGIIAPDANGGDKRWILTGFTPVAAATGWTGTGGTTSKTLTVDETVAISSKPTVTSSTWTPVITLESGSPTYVSQSGKYMKIGSLVHIEIAIIFTAVANGVIIDTISLPFAPANPGNAALPIAAHYNINLGIGGTVMEARPVDGNATLSLCSSGNNTAQLRPMTVTGVNMQIRLIGAYTI